MTRGKVIDLKQKRLERAAKAVIEKLGQPLVQSDPDYEDELLDELKLYVSNASKLEILRMYHQNGWITRSTYDHMYRQIIA